jgi:hypothetical protein
MKLWGNAVQYFTGTCQPANAVATFASAPPTYNCIGFAARSLLAAVDIINNNSPKQNIFLP